MLRVVFVSEDHSAEAGGVPAVVRQLSDRTDKAGVSTDLVVVREHAMSSSGSVRMHRAAPSTGGERWGWSPSLTRTLSGLAATRPSAVFHLHGIWSAAQFFAARTAARYRLPFVLSAHGMLDPWLWNHQGWRTKAKKKAYWRIFAYPAFRRAAVLHAITPLERDYLHDLFPQATIEVIPNAVEVTGNRSDGEQTTPDRQILFLGRIEPKKGLHLLLHAFASARIDLHWRLDIVGPVWSQSYLRTLRSIVTQTGTEERVRFLEPVFGQTKTEYLRKAWVVVLPSYSEAMGLVNLEAAASDTPSITTFETGLHDWGSGGGVLTHPDVEDLRKSLESACSWSMEERRERGVASRRLVERRYSWTTVFPMWLDLYKRLGAGVATQ